MRKIYKFLDRLENTKRFVGVLVFIILVSSFISQTENAESLGLISISKNHVYTIVQVLLILLIIIFLLEGGYHLLIRKMLQINRLLRASLSITIKVARQIFKRVYIT